ncbi:MAG: trypsin-like peptidase domain-containing protein [SAR324 cluster bacterium]|nr:trypsin-like peptidase domain-containing protein [SAR324 cluster bacterium]
MLRFFGRLIVVAVFMANTHSASFAGELFDFVGYKKTENKTTAFSHISISTDKSGLSFLLNLHKSGHVRISHSFSDKIKIITDKNFTAGEDITFPDAGKSIYLSNPGTHKFTASVNSGSQTQTQDLLVIVGSPLDTLPHTSLDVGANETLTQAPRIDLSNHLKKLESTKLEGVEYAQLSRTRGAGSQVFKDVADSVVLIASEDTIGSGVIIDDQGHILTNWHVVNVYESVAIIFRPPNFSDISASEKYIADVIKLDEEKDLALVKIRHPPKNIRPVKLGSPESVEIAMDVHAIGHPNGNLWTYTNGVISQIRPKFNWSGQSRLVHMADVLQTQTPINPGNSGGPLLTDKSRLIGINSFIDPDGQGLNFSVAITSIEAFLAQKNSITRAKKRPDDEQEIRTVRIDTDEDGYKELWALDVNDNGVPDLYKLDLDKDNSPDVLFIDKNENEIPEITIEFVIVEGEEIAVYSHDFDEDGVIDAYSYDFDMDGEIDKIDPA